MGNDGHVDSPSPFTCHLCSKSFDQVDQLGLHRRMTHDRVLKKVIVKKRIRTWAPVTTTTKTQTEQNGPPTTFDPPIDPMDHQTDSLKPNNSFKYKSNRDDHHHEQPEEFDSVLNSEQKSTAGENNLLEIDEVEDEPNLDFYDDEPESLLGTDMDPQDDERISDPGEVKKIEIKVVENPNTRRKQRIQSRQVQEVEDVPSDEVECLGAFKQIANCSLSVALAMKAAKMRMIMAKKLLADQRRLAILKKQGILKLNGPSPTSPTKNPDDPSSSTPSTTETAVGTVVEKSPKSRLRFNSHRKKKRRPGTPWNRQQLRQSNTPKIKEEVEDKSNGRGRPKKSKKSDDSADAIGAEEKTIDFVQVKVKEKESSVSWRGRRRLKSAKYQQDFCDPSALDVEQS